MKTIWIDRETAYDGTQLRSHWIYEQTRELCDAIVAFVGPADVPTKHMVDLVDVANDAPIFSRRMLHVIVEHFGAELPLAIARQRLLVAIAAEILRPACPALARRGNDLMAGEKKLSVCIATASPVSTLVHFAINVESAGTPVPTLGLADLGLDPKSIGEQLLAGYAGELASMEEARCKVRPVP